MSSDAPTFRKVASSLDEFLHGCDLCGFNLKKFDLRLLHMEFQRCNQPFSLDGRAIIDPMEIFHSFEKRDLNAAVRFYLQREHDQAHSAEGDVLATAELLDAMLDRYPSLPIAVEDLHVHFKDPKAVDSNGRFVRINGEVRFAFGKFRGQPILVVAREDPDYLKWMLAQDFFSDTKAVVTEALNHNQQ
jgi:DNA polymerase III subunit epsilon